MQRLLPRRDDPVFQLSLTEAAFTVAFLLLLVAGLVVAKIERERESARQALEALQGELARVRAQQTAVEGMLTELRRELGARGVENLDERLSELVKRTAEQSDAQHMQARLDLLTRRLAALESLRALLERLHAGEPDELVRDRVERALAVLQGIESVRGAPAAGRELEAAARLARDAERLSQVLAENAKLRAQLAYVRRQAPGERNKSGFGLPPCWLDHAGRVQRIVDVTIGDRGLLIRPAWPPERAAEAASAGVHSLVGAAPVLALDAFRRQAQPLYDWSRRQDPECRHYAQVFVAAKSVEAAVRGKNAVYEFFYPAGQEILSAERF